MQNMPSDSLMGIFDGRNCVGEDSLVLLRHVRDGRSCIIALNGSGTLRDIMLSRDVIQIINTTVKLLRDISRNRSRMKRSWGLIAHLVGNNQTRLRRYLIWINRTLLSHKLWSGHLILIFNKLGSSSIIFPLDGNKIDEDRV